MDGFCNSCIAKIRTKVKAKALNDAANTFFPYFKVDITNSQEKLLSIFWEFRIQIVKDRIIFPKCHHSAIS